MIEFLSILGQGDLPAMEMTLLSTFPVQIVGSALWKDNPRDIDVACILPDKDFEKYFRIPYVRWLSEGYDGKWSKERWDWADSSIRVCNLLSRRLGIPVDFMFVPQSYHILVSHGVNPFAEPR